MVSNIGTALVRRARCRWVMASAFLLCMLCADTAMADVGGARGSIGFLQVIPLWGRLALVVFLWWLLSLGLSQVIWKPLDNAPLAARWSMALFAALSLVFVHFFILKFTMTYLIVISVVFIILCLVLWYSYATLGHQN